MIESALNDVAERKMIKQLKFQRLLAMIYLGCSVGIIHFWWQFFNDGLFIREDLQALMPHFEGYYLWERSFVIPDMVLAFAMLISALPLWTNKWMSKGRVLALASAGAALFLGLLDLAYGFSSGLYALNHSYAGVVLEAGLSMLVVGLISFAILLFAPRVAS